MCMYMYMYVYVVHQCYMYMYNQVLCEAVKFFTLCQPMTHMLHHGLSRTQLYGDLILHVGVMFQYMYMLSAVFCG